MSTWSLLRIGMVTLALGLAAVPACAPAQADEYQNTISDRASIVDGQTLVLRGHHLRLWGVIAPTGAQPGAVEAAIRMFKLYDGKMIYCHLATEDRSRVMPAKCEFAGFDMSAVMVSSGWVRDCPIESGGRYRIQEAKAKAAGSPITDLMPLPELCGGQRKK
jgi:endonuclease YncB( thermonuclease family)